ncbi:hypothetical protein QZH41_002826 [Actinostola sp. cb2023]|nr:hypothetical protein QZH41_002826 [Actinostola sp. cb2023]
MPDGSERPVGYASRSLTSTENKYAQIEKEALGIVWGVKKFQSYLEGRHFKLQTDHKPLKLIMDPKKAILVTSAARIQRWCLFLGALIFSYEIEHRGTKEHVNCDGLSRIPRPVAPKDQLGSVGCFYTTVIDTLPVTERELRRETRRDPGLAQVVRLVEEGWDSYEACPELTLYALRKEEIVIHNGVLMWGGRVVVPSKLRSKVIDVLHEGHIDTVKMKGLGCSYTWWPHMDKEIEETVKSCEEYQRFANNPVSVPLHRWEYPASP